jgi:hypothetical protein
MAFSPSSLPSIVSSPGALVYKEGAHDKPPGIFKVRRGNALTTKFG